MDTIKYVNIQNSAQEEHDDSETTEEVDRNSNIILCVMWKCNKMVASYYNVDQKMLYTVMETFDKAPKFFAAQALIRQTSPKHVITMGKIAEPFVQALIGCLLNADGKQETDKQYVSLPANMTLLDFKDFTFNACLYRVRRLQLQSQPTDTQTEDRLNYIQTLINVDSTKTVYALGALIKFLEQTWHNMRPSGDDALIFLHIKQVALDDHVYIDNTTFNALNVFNLMRHDSAFKHGGLSSCREGVSLFKLLSLHCVSQMGFLKLREILMSPIKNMNELAKRYEFMDFIVDPRHTPIATAINAALHKITNVYKIFGKIKHSQGNAGHWRALYGTIYALLQVNEEIKPFLTECSIFREYHKVMSENLYRVEATINTTLDLKVGLNRDRPAVKEHIDDELDEAKSTYNTIQNRLVAAARIVVNHLPPQLEECTVSFVPDMGHIISVRKWSPKCTPEELLPYGCYFLFESSSIFHYKTALCQELDKQLGDLPLVVQDHENRIIQRVAAFVIEQNVFMLNPLEQLAYMDALISMAKVGKERNYVRPLINEHNMLEIKDGRHPLAEINNESYVPNHYMSGGLHRPMKIITGPNASGKSMFLKQVALLVYMAHVGSYLPAAAANISMVHSIHSRLHANESAALNMSAFTIDLIQMGNALYSAKPSSLVVMDEFGRGTTGNVTKALLLSALRHFLHGDNICPHVVVSTHLTLEKEYLESPLVHFQKMSHMRHPETNAITFLYKIQDGETSSCTFEMAEVLEPSILQRAKEIYASLSGDKPELTPEEEEQFFLDVKCPPFDD